MKLDENSRISSGFHSLLCSAFIGFLILVSSCSTKEHATTDQYTCPMHPTVLSATQGSCPVCGMDLVRKSREGEELKITEDIARLLQSPDEAVVANMKTVRGSYRKIPMVMEAQGLVTYDSRYVHVLPARVGGRLEQVHLRFALQPVKKGQKVAEIYSPEMLTAQRELLFISTGDSGNVALMNAAREKLMLLGATQAQVDEWLQTGEPSAEFPVFSPYEGYVILPEITMPTPTAPASPGGSMGESGMGSPTVAPTRPNNTSSPATLIREGDYVTRGQTLFTIINRDALLVELSLPARRSGKISIGTPVTLDVGANEPVRAQVDFVQPFYSEGEDFLKVRVYVRRSNLRIGQLVRASFSGESPEALWLPKEAVYDLGTTQVVFVKDRGLFKPRTVTTGIRSNGWTEIRSGLASADDVAAQAAYLVDSESFVKTGSTK